MDKCPPLTMLPTSSGKQQREKDAPPSQVSFGYLNIFQYQRKQLKIIFKNNNNNNNNNNNYYYFGSTKASGISSVPYCTEFFLHKG